MRRSNPVLSTLRVSSVALQSTVLEEDMLDGDHIVVAIELKNNPFQVSSHAFVDCGASGYAFVDEDFARDHQFPLFKLKKPRQLEVIDGRPIESGLITYITKLPLSIGGHNEEVFMFVTKLGHYPIVLGLP